MGLIYDCNLKIELIILGVFYSRAATESNIVESPSLHCRSLLPLQRIESSMFAVTRHCKLLSPLSSHIVSSYCFSSKSNVSSKSSGKSFWDTPTAHEGTMAITFNLSISILLSRIVGLCFHDLSPLDGKCLSPPSPPIFAWEPLMDGPPSLTGCHWSREWSGELSDWLIYSEY